MRRALGMVLLMLLSLPVMTEVSASGCVASAPQGATIDRIEVDPGFYRTLPADHVNYFNATVFDDAGAEVNTGVHWQASAGTLTDLGANQARWVVEVLGPQTLTVCVGDVETVVNVEGVLGTPVSWEIRADRVNVTADEVIQLIPTMTDVLGNEQYLMPLDMNSWDLPPGASVAIDHLGMLTFHPGLAGTWNISGSLNGFDASLMVNITPGLPVELGIETAATTVSSDDAIELCAVHRDHAGNSFEVVANWTALDPADLDRYNATTGHCVSFDPGPLGQVVLGAEAFGLSRNITLQVEVGRLAQIRLPDHPTEMALADAFPLTPVGFDAAGNPVEVIGWNYTVLGPGSPEVQIAADGALFVPDTPGQHEIRVLAANRVGVLVVEVHAGTPVELEIESSAAMVETGGTLDLTTWGVDANGNRMEVDADWIVRDGYGSIRNASGGTGHYIWDARGVGHVELFASVGDVSGTIILAVLPGALDHFEVHLPTGHAQGEQIEFTIQGYDVSGNRVDVHPCAVKVVSDAGEATCDGAVWRMDLVEGGDQLRVHVSHEGASGVGFIDVEPTWFGGVFGSNTQVLIIGIFLAAIAVGGMLVVLYRTLGGRIEDEREAIAEEEEPDATPAPEMAPPLPSLHQPPGPSPPQVQIQPPPRLERGPGPVDGAHGLLKAIPGTEAGQDGWYFDPYNRPQHWVFTEDGWTRNA